MINSLRIPLLALLLLAALNVQAQTPEFPELTGRVVDQAELLEATVESRLSGMLKAHEDATFEQVVVVTVPDLQGNAIEEYGYLLGRHWGIWQDWRIGQKGKDNGALLIVAPNERKVRIAVGYGLEGRLTNTQSSAIINQIITPSLSEGDYAQGISQGVEAMIQVLGGDPVAEATLAAEFQRRRDTIVTRAKDFIAAGRGNIDNLAAALEIDHLGTLDRLKRGSTLSLDPVERIAMVTYEGERHYQVNHVTSSPFAKLEREFRSKQDFSRENWEPMIQVTMPEKTEIACLFDSIGNVPSEVRDVSAELLSFSRDNSSTLISFSCE